MSEEKHSSGPHPSNTESLEQAAMQDNQIQDIHAQLMREKEEPQEGFSPVPIFLMFVFAALCFWGGVYLVDNSGGFRWDAYSPDFDPHAGAAAPVEVPLFDRGAKVFRNQCAQCHQASGQGVSGVYPPLADSDWVTGHPEVVARILINGLSGPIEVNGGTYNGNMPAFGPSGLNLKPKEMAGVITYIRQEWGNQASDMTEVMMETYLAEYASRGTAWSAGELREGLSAEPTPQAAEAESSTSEVDEAVATPAAHEPAHH